MRIIAGSAVLALVLPMTAATVANAHPPNPGGRSGTSADSAYGFELLAHVNPGTGATGDVFAHRGIAYLASWVGQNCLGKGVRVYDLRDPRRPRHLSTFADASDPRFRGSWTEKVIVQRVHTRAFHGDLAVVSFQNCAEPPKTGFVGFGLYDVSRPAKPRLLSLYAAPKTNGSHEIWLGSRGGRAYVYTAIIRSELTTSPDYDPVTKRATKPGRADFRIVDVSRPTHPRDVGEWGAWRKLGVAPFADGKSNFVHSVRVDDQLHRAYLSYWDLGTVILDIRNPARPRYLGRTPAVQKSAHSSYLARGGRLLIETHETLGGLPRLWNIANPARPWLVSTFTLPGAAETSVHDPKVRGNTLYFSWYNFGVVAVDMSDPTHPHKVAQWIPNTPYINPDYFCEEACADVWGVFLHNGLVLASDLNSGLYVLRHRPTLLPIAATADPAPTAPSIALAVLVLTTAWVLLRLRAAGRSVRSGSARSSRTRSARSGSTPPDRAPVPAPAAGPPSGRWHPPGRGRPAAWSR